MPRLAHDMPRMDASAKARVEAILSVDLSPYGCSDHNCFALTRRVISGRATIYLQCTTCGRSAGGALARAGHYFWQDYPEWDKELEAGWQAARDAEHEEWRRNTLAEQEAARQARLAEYAGYAEWLRTNPDWHRIRDRVLWRSRGHCEACLTAQADRVHHLTYANGKLPPAWRLRAVCKACHDRLHATGDEWCDPGMERS